MAAYTPSLKDTRWTVRTKILNYLQTLSGASAENAPVRTDTRWQQKQKILKELR